MRLEKTNPGVITAENICGKIVNDERIRLLNGSYTSGDIFILFIDLALDSGTTICSGICIVDGEPDYGQVDVKVGDKCWDGAIIGSDGIALADSMKSKVA